MGMLEIFVIQGINYNQSPGDEVIGQLGNEKFTFTIERPLLSDFLLSEKLGDARKFESVLLGSVIVAQRRRRGDGNFTSTSASDRFADGYMTVNLTIK